MTYTEDNKYKLKIDYYEHIILLCTYVEDNTVYLKATSTDIVTTYQSEDCYKVSMKTNKLYKWNSLYMSWDNIENTLSEYSAADVWSKRTGNDYYSGVGQND